ncbi:hypothetical protein NA57DRAFT_70359 [Rhizodiscina lignyota]|uniref:Uncharacterized protein n=1 Tax=Rhizodiscina lignyota TaxID=1504668 RepID=A0A9P4ITT0_9PEZI|nr:hypothetical protein NA57DRAFT_70359 [Rhizodiscina lignyota]
MPSSSMHTRERMNKWFQPGDGIAREVITADIQRYLGRDALVRPGTQNGAEGYWITAYRNLTSEMVTDLKQDSLRWRAEQQGHSTRGGSPHITRDLKGARYPDLAAAAPAYLDSQTHQSRQYYGPSVTPAPVESHYGAPAPQRDPYGAAPVRETAGYPSQAHAAYAVSAGYPQSTGATYQSQPAGYQEASYQSPASAYSNIHAPTPSAYSSASNYSASTQASSYSSASPGYPAPAQGSGYVTSTTPQSYDQSSQPRTVAYEGYAPPGTRTAADPYAAYRTTQGQAQPGYGYPAGTATTSRENVYQSGQAQPAGSRYLNTPSRNHLDIWLDDAKPPSMQYDDRGVL